MDLPDVDAVYGVDFSAAADDAGTLTWVAHCEPTGDGLAVEELATASEWLGCDATDRETVLPELAASFAGLDDSAVVGLDFPFSLPGWVFPDGSAWADFVEGTPERWGVLDGVDDPESLFHEAREAAETDGKPNHRSTDCRHGGQSPTGWRIKTQTYYGISCLLAELAADPHVRVLPMLTRDGAPVTVLETYPAAVFEALDGAHRTGYKGSSRCDVDRRLDNLDALRDAGLDVSSDRDGGASHEDCAVATDDALDALAAAYAAAATHDDALRDAEAGRGRREGRIYAGPG